MKIQDIGFFVILVALLVFRKRSWLVFAGLFSLIVSIPLFAKWVFFTAERLTWYSAAFFVVALIMNLIPERRVS